MKHLTSAKYIFFALFFLSIIACKKDNTTAEKTLDGYWESVGYGRIAKVENGQFSLYDITDISCLQVLDGEVSDFGNNITYEGDTLSIKDGINMYYFNRLDSIPAICNQEISAEKMNDPVYNFEVLSNAFKNHYAYFEERNINWETMYNKYKSMVNSETTAAELYNIMEDMLDSFNDGHIGLSAPDDVEEAASELRNETSETIEKQSKNPPVKQYQNHEVANAIAEHYIKDLKSRRNKMVQWGSLNDKIGYMQINQMMGLGDYQLADSLSGRDYWLAFFEKADELPTEEFTKKELEGIKSIMNEVMNDLSDKDAIIIDVRFNGGGKDEVGLEILRHFNDKKRLVFTKKARLGEGYTKPIEVELLAIDNAFKNPVYLLTSKESASATEIMILSSLSLDNITRVGGTSEGVFSDIFERVLPNGWEFGLSNEVYLDTKGNNYEGKGIVPDVDLNYSTDKQEFLSTIMNNLSSNGDAAIEKLINN
ncbi:MAG: S41 family peptidase [Flavobacteriaceae bacterium]|nr:S41 family peptidase [Flavobacteriaceae bacterium]